LIWIPSSSSFSSSSSALQPWVSLGLRRTSHEAEIKRY
jgi:hypothetical protein